MKPDSMLVDPEFLMDARQEVVQVGVGTALDAVGESEPALASFIYESLAAIAGKLALSGAPTPLVQGLHEESLTLVLTCIQSLRRGHYELWKDSIKGTPLAKLDPSLKAKPTRPRKKGREPGPDSDESAEAK
jgi:hypothetical protein